VKNSTENIHQDGLINFDQVQERSRIRKWLRYMLFIRPIVHQLQGYVLDIGCGPGVYLEYYPGPSLGIDAHPNNIRICKAKGVRAIQEDANQFVKEETFDTILISHVLEHLDNPAGVIENAYLSLKYGGRIIIIVPCYEGFAVGLNGENAHKHFIDEDYINEKMKSLGGKKMHSSIFPPLLGGIYKELRMIFEK